MRENNELSKGNENMNIKTQIKDISKRCKDRFNRMIEDALYKYDCIYYYNRYHKFYKGSTSTMQLFKDNYNVSKIKHNIELCAIYWHFLLVVWFVLFGLMLAT